MPRLEPGGETAVPEEEDHPWPRDGDAPRPIDESGEDAGDALELDACPEDLELVAGPVGSAEEVDDGDFSWLRETVEELEECLPVPESPVPERPLEGGGASGIGYLG